MANSAKKDTLKLEQIFLKKEGQFGHLLIKLNEETLIEIWNFIGQARSNKVFIGLIFRFELFKHCLLSLAQQSLLSLAQQALLSLAQQALPNWPNIYKLAPWSRSRKYEIDLNPS